MASGSDRHFSTVDELREWAAVFGEAGLRLPGSAVHERLVDWMVEEFSKFPGVQVVTESSELKRWTPLPEHSLERAGELRIGPSGEQTIPIAGAVPYAAPTGEDPTRGTLIYLPPERAFSKVDCAGRIVVRDVDWPSLSLGMLKAAGLHWSDDVDESVRGFHYDRPFLAPLHDELQAAAKAGAAGVVFAFDVRREDVASYFDPHSGTHYSIPAVFVGRDERQTLLALANDETSAEMAIAASVESGTTRSVFATLPGQADTRIVVVSHSDGATWVQENGPVALLALAEYFSQVPLEHRPYTLQFAVTSCHLHMSREASHRFAADLDDEYDGGKVAMVVALEHLGAREVVPNQDGELAFSGLGEILLWAVGPSRTMRQSVVNACVGRALDGVIVSEGFGVPSPGTVPLYTSFGGIGTYFHTRLIPTMALVSGPWSLWAPSFGESAIDFDRMRNQILAVADVVVELGDASRESISGDYAADRAARASGFPTYAEELPAE